MSISYFGQSYERSNTHVYIGSEAAQARSQLVQSSALPSGSLFSSFLSLAAAISPEIAGNDSDNLLGIPRSGDLGIITQGLISLGNGSSFMVSALNHDVSLGHRSRFVLKRTIPIAKKQNDATFQNRIKMMMLELRTLAHDPIRKHENIVNLLGLTWETDPFDIERKWPVFLVERATRGSLFDLFEMGTPFSLPIRLNLILDVILGLEVLHLCGVIHGDLKFENVLVFDNPDYKMSDRQFIAKLADFGGSLFGISTSSYLPSGTQPWNAPEWDKQLDQNGLQLTDIYSLGFLAWRILANGKHPFLPECQSTSQETWLKGAENIKEDDDDLHNHLMQISKFESEIEQRLAEKIIIRTIRKNPANRNITEVKNLVQEITRSPRPPPDFGGLNQRQCQLRNIFLPYSYQGTGYISPAITQYISKELLRGADSSIRPEEIAEARYGLAVLSINGIVDFGQEHNDMENWLNWLFGSAVAGCDRAQAISYRVYRALIGPAAIGLDNIIAYWLLDTLSKGFFLTVEDIHDLNIPETQIECALRTLRFRYGGTGSQRYEHFPKLHDTRAPWETSAEQIQEFDERLCESYKDRGEGYVQIIVEYRRRDNGLHHAASCGLYKTVEYLIGRDPQNINCLNVNGETPLLLACRSGHYFPTMALLEAGADPSIASENGDTPLHWLLSFDAKYVGEVCRHLTARLDQKSWNAVASEWGYIYCAENKFVRGTPLIRAVSRNRLDVVQALLDAGVDPSFAVDRCTTLNIAVQLHYPHMIKAILSKLPPDSLTSGVVEQSTGISLLWVAISGGSLEEPGSRFGRIRRHGYLWRNRAHETLRIILDLGSKDHLHDFPDLPGTTALGIAASDADVDVVEFLLEHGSKDSIDKPSAIPQKPNHLYAPLSCAIWSKNLPVFHLLIENGANTKTLAQPPEPYSLLYECAVASNDRVEFAQLLIDSGIQVDQRLEGYETPFACALRNRCFNLAECLWKNGANVNIEYTEGMLRSSLKPMTVLGHLIGEYNISSLSCLSFLLRDRSQLSTADFIVCRSKDMTALHAIALAPYKNQEDNSSGLVLGYILDYFKPTQEQLSMQSSVAAGYTALQIAVMMSNYPVVQGLLSAGVDPLAENELGYSALGIANDVLVCFPESFGFESSKTPERALKKAKKRAEDVFEAIENAYNNRLE